MYVEIITVPDPKLQLINKCVASRGEPIVPIMDSFNIPLINELHHTKRSTPSVTDGRGF